MKRILVALVGMLLIGLATASAQIIMPLQFTVDSPFYVGKALLPAGTYQVFPTDQLSLLSIRNISAPKSAFMMALTDLNAKTPNSSSVIFNRYGDTLVLKTLIEEGSLESVSAPTSPVEKNLMRESGPAATVVLPAARVSKKA